MRTTRSERVSAARHTAEEHILQHRQLCNVGKNSLELLCYKRELEHLLAHRVFRLIRKHRKRLSNDRAVWSNPPRLLCLGACQDTASIPASEKPLSSESQEWSGIQRETRVEAIRIQRKWPQ